MSCFISWGYKEVLQDLRLNRIPGLTGARLFRGWAEKGIPIEMTHSPNPYFSLQNFL